MMSQRADRLANARLPELASAPITGFDRTEIVAMAERLALRDEECAGLMARLAAYDGALAALDTGCASWRDAAVFVRERVAKAIRTPTGQAELAAARERGAA